MNKTVTALSLLVTFGATALQAAPELKGSPDELSYYLLDQRKIIIINGSALEEVEADTAIVAITVRTKEAKLNDALQENEKTRKAIKDNLQQAGITADKIKASKFSSSPNYGWFGEKPSSYEIDNEMKITISSEEQLRAVAKVVDEHKSVLMGGTEFKDSQKEGNEQKVLKKALSAVQEKQKAYEQGLGIVLTPIRVIDQNVYAQTPQRIRPQTRGYEKRSDGVAAMVMSAPAVESEASADFGAMSYSANATVEFVVK